MTSLATDARIDDAASASLLARAAVLAYGAASYAMFFGVFLYSLAFIVGFGVPVTLDTLPVAGDSMWTALAVNLGLLMLFALQHSVMARPAFKKWWTKFVPTAVERSTYVLFTNIAMIAMMVLWQPMGGVVWDVQHTVGRGALYGLGAAGWIVVLAATFLINHFDLFGLRQVWLYAKGEAYRPLKFKTPAMYRVVRHPLYVGWMMAFWFAPTMTVAHLVFALGSTAYILIAIRLEERDLVTEHGASYESYQESVPMLVPFSKSGKGATV